MEALVLVGWVWDCLSVGRLQAVEVAGQGLEQEIYLGVEFRNLFVEVFRDGPCADNATTRLGT